MKTRIWLLAATLTFPLQGVELNKFKFLAGCAFAGAGGYLGMKALDPYVGISFTLMQLASHLLVMRKLPAQEIVERLPLQAQLAQAALTSQEIESLIAKASPKLIPNRRFTIPLGIGAVVAIFMGKKLIDSAYSEKKHF